MAYQRPKNEVDLVRKEPKMKGCEEKENSQVPQYKTTVFESTNLDGIQENYHFPITYKAQCLNANFFCST